MIYTNTNVVVSIRKGNDSTDRIDKGRCFDRVTSFEQRFERNDAECHVIIGLEKRNVPDRGKSKRVLMLGVFEDW